MVTGIINRAENSSTKVPAAPAQPEKRVSFPGCPPEPDPATDADRDNMSRKSSKNLLCPAECDDPANSMGTAGGSSRRGTLVGRSSKKLLQTPPDNADATATAPTADTKDLGQPSKLTRQLFGMLTGRSSHKLLSTAAEADADSEATSSSAPAAGAVAGTRGLLGGKSSRKLLRPTAADADSEAATPSAQATSTAAVSRGMLGSRSSRKLIAPATADPVIASQPPILQQKQSAVLQQTQLTANAAGFRARLVTRSSRRLLLASIKEDPGTPTSEASTPVGGLRAVLSGKSSSKLLLSAVTAADKEDGVSSPASSAALACPSQVFNLSAPISTNSRANLVSRSSKKLLGKSGPELDVDSSSSTSATCSSSSSTTAANARIMLAGRSSRKLLSNTGSDLELESRINSFTACSSSSSTTAGSTRAMLAGRSSRKLLCKSDPQLELENCTACSTSATAARGMLTGRSSRRLLRGTSRTSDPAESTVAVPDPANPPTAEFAGQAGSISCSAMLAGKSSQKLLASFNARRQSNSDSQNLAPDASSRRLSASNSRRALLAGRSSRKLLGFGALSHVSSVTLDDSRVSLDESSNPQLADAIVHIRCSISDDKSSTTLGSAKPGEREQLACTAASAADLDSLVLLLSNAADKDALLLAVAELQELAACGTSCGLSHKLLIAQNHLIVQSLGNLVGHADAEVQCAAAALIHGLASGVPQIQATLGSSSSIISGLTAMLGKSARTHAAVALWVLAADSTEARSKIGATGGVDLVADLTHMMTDPAAGSYAAGLTWTLVASNRENQALFAGTDHPVQRVGGVIAWLLMLIKEGSEEEQEYAAGALQALLDGNEDVIRLARVLGVGQRVQKFLKGQWSSRAYEDGDVGASAQAAESMQEVAEILGL